ncbi:phage baseplate assembly protein V [Myxococcus sp. RHSTA-1-4]|uniref:phage baseplate assembly protein V n=1 Tax=Myxococcus sp. RHSTA-1-4 TaxID=2874601 RepID=UPI001CC067B8|nr:phage baseplate assembly protein V [Myxococcus sp. RHSTA-1-4]MBZ4417431.1 phage baseplate assembly protein V [Myxococcus sp. RHSTA-1-4]
MLQASLQRHAGRYYGKYSGEVTGNADEQHLGRLLVRVPAIFGGELAVRARPCLPYGCFFIPPVGTKVWVEFEAGDPQYPIWVGTWHPTGTTPPEAAVSPPEHRLLHTPSGHSLELRDAEGEQEVVLRHRGNVALRIAPEGTVTLTLPDGAHLTLHAAGQAVLVNKEGSQLELSGNTARVVATNISLQGTTVDVGEDASEPTLRGQSFKTLWDAFVLHTHATAVGPSGPPVPPVGPLQPGVHLTTSARVK